jgi:hypothetical protein
MRVPEIIVILAVSMPAAAFGASDSPPGEFTITTFSGTGHRRSGLVIRDR